MKKISEHTYGTHIYMRIELHEGEDEEISAYIRDYGITYKTSADNDPERRQMIIDAFNYLY